MRPRRGASEDDFPWDYEYTTPPPPLMQRRGVRQLIVGTGVAAVATCVILGASALVSDGSSAPKFPNSLRVARTNTVGSGLGAPTTSLPPATTPAPPSASKHKVVAKKHRTQSPTNRGVIAPQTHTVPPRPPGVQGKGIVIVHTVAGFEEATAEGTGMLMSSDGDILTNNHVVRGGTFFRITVAGTGKTYRADVVGTDPSADVAVIHIRRAAGLPVASFGNSSDVRNATVSDRIVAVGNAHGRGKLRTARGKVTALGRTITARDDDGNNPERLTGLIRTNAHIVAGDSGGPLYDSTSHIIGMDTAAIVQRRASGAATLQSFAIPITRALKIAKKIVAGHASARIHIGVPAITGVSVVDSARGGAYVKGVVRGGPADRAGVHPGSVIIAIDGVRVTSVKSIHAQLNRHRPGQHVSLTWVDWLGFQHTARLTLAKGAAD